MAESFYWAAGAALGLAEGYAYAVETLVPGGAKLTRLIGFESARGRVRTLGAWGHRGGPYGTRGMRLPT